MGKQPSKPTPPFQSGKNDLSEQMRMSTNQSGEPKARFKLIELLFAKSRPRLRGREEGRYLQPYLTVTAMTVDWVTFAEVAVTVTFVVPAGVAGVPGELPHPTITMAEANSMTTTPNIRRLANCLRRRKASSEPNGSIIAEATTKRP